MRPRNLALENGDNWQRSSSLSLDTTNPAVLPSIDWQAPRSALHDHIEQQKLITVSLPSSPLPRRTLAEPRQSKAGQQQRRIKSDIRQADRGTRLVFGGKLPASAAQRTAQLDHTAGQAGKNSNCNVKRSSKPDPWLASWQPKSKPSGEEKSPNSQAQGTPSITTWRNPSLEWAITKPAPGRVPAPAPGDLSRPKEGKLLKKPENFKGRKEASQDVQPNSSSELSRQKAPETLPAPTKRAALQHLAQLRNLRRLPLAGPSASLSAPCTPSAARVADLSASELYASTNELLNRTTSQPACPEPASTSGTDMEPVYAHLAESPGQDTDIGSSQSAQGTKGDSCAAERPDKLDLLTIKLPSPPRRGASLTSSASVCKEASERSASRAPSVHRQSAEPATGSPVAMPNRETLLGETDAAPMQRVVCEGCGRGFNTKAYTVHSKICAKVFQKERIAHAVEKIGDSRSGILGGSIYENFASITSIAMAASPLKKGKSDSKDAAGKTGPAIKPGSLPKWKQQSAQLRAAMLAARPDKLGQAAAAVPGAVVAADDLVPCPHCKRRFAEATAERHIPKCKETVHKATRLKVGGGRAAHMRNPVTRK